MLRKIGIWFLLLVAFVVVLIGIEAKKSYDAGVQAEKEAKCKQTPSCADQAAEIDSMISDGPVRGYDAYYFKGFRCLQTCEGHLAGYRWAESEQIKNPWQCTGTSTSFLQGCHAYLSDNGYSFHY